MGVSRPGARAIIITMMVVMVVMVVAWVEIVTAVGVDVVRATIVVSMRHGRESSIRSYCSPMSEQQPKANEA